jgi:hypothetical protein
MAYVALTQEEINDLGIIGNTDNSLNFFNPQSGIITAPIRGLNFIEDRVNADLDEYINVYQKENGEYFYTISRKTEDASGNVSFSAYKFYKWED